jgi:hypothetical protein
MIPQHRVKPNSKVDIWDLGPTRPVAPSEPEAVNDKLKGAELALAQVEYDDAIDLYKRELRAYAALKRDHERWHKENGGPVKIEQWGVDARHSLDNFPERYKLDLPKGVKPGKAQLDAEEMAKAEGEELALLRERDPNFGKPQGISP